MRSVFLIVAISALAWARPETYRENEDFQYSRSSSDEGSKSGFYGAQRGNMGGNFEKAHNMDSLAQNQMSGAVRQVEGELGDAAKTRTGSVFTAANSRGIYGSGKYDLSNLQGRNFAESSSLRDTHSSLSSAYNQNSQNSDWRSALSASNQLGQGHAAEDINGIYTNGQSNYEKSHSSGFHSHSRYHSQSEYQGGSAYDQLGANTHTGSFGAQAGDQTQSRYIVTPVRVYGRPGTHIAVPVFAQAYDTQKSSALSQNSLNTEAEVLNNNQQHVSGVPLGNAKHYESSYDYRKAWERHSESNPSNTPLAMTTINPFPKKSELNEDAQTSSGFNSQQHTNVYNSHNSHLQSDSSESTHQSDYRSQHNALSGSSSNAHSHGVHGSLSGDEIYSQPKSYQSAYSYHKSWERQGDPYVIVPVTNGGIKNSASASSSQYRQSHQHAQGNYFDCDCDEHGHPRAKRSFEQENQSEKFEDLGKKVGQQTENMFGTLQNFGQQTQNTWENIDKKNRSDNLEDVGKQAQDIAQGLAQQTKNTFGALRDIGQQTQNTWGSFGQRNRPEKSDDFGKESDAMWREFGQQNQNKFGASRDLGQQTQHSWGTFEEQKRPEQLDFGKRNQDIWQGFGQQTQNTFGSLRDPGQQTQHTWDNFGQQNRRFEDFGKQSQHTFNDLVNQQTQSKLNEFSNLDQQTQQTFDIKDFTEQQSQNGNIEDLGQQTQQSFDIKDFTEQQSQNGNIEDLGQQTQHKWDHMENFGSQFLTHWGTADKNRDTSGTEQQTQIHAHSVNQMKDDKQHAGHNTNTQHIMENTNYFHNPNHPAILSASTEQTQQFNDFLNQHSYSNVHSHSNSQADGVNWQETSHKTEEQTTENNPLQSLWDKIDNLEEQYEHSSYDRHDPTEYTGYESSQHSYYGSTYHYGSTSGVVSNSINGTQHQTRYNEHKPLLTINETEKTNKKPHREHQNKKDNHDTENSDIPEIVEASEVGRGDIGADDSQSDKTSSKNVPVFEMVSIDVKPEKTPEEIEALSLSSGTEKSQNADNSDSDSLTVLSLSQQKWLQDQRQTDLQKTNGSSIPFNRTHHLGTTNENTKFNENNLGKPLHFENSSYNRFNAGRHDYDRHNKEIESESTQNSGQQVQDLDLHKQFDQETLTMNRQNTGQRFEHFGQSLENSNQFNGTDDFSQTLHQQSTGLQLEDFGQHNQYIDQQNYHQFETQEQLGQKLEQQNTWQQLADFGQKTQDLNQQNLQHFESQNQQNIGQQLQDFGQQSQDLRQQSLQQFGTSGKFEQNIDQQHTDRELEDFGQQSQDLGQQNLEQFDTSGKLSQNLNQQITGQLEDFGQQSQDLTQQNLQQFENLDQQNQNVYQHGAWKEANEFNGLNKTKDKNDKKPIHLDHPTNNEEIHEEKIVENEIPASQSNPKQEVEIPAIPPTEKPGFWKSVGHKFTNAKESVASWFKRS